jgi:general secretion pathway protein H
MLRPKVLGRQVLGRQAGFTLIELIVVIVVMALIGTLVLARGPWHSAGFDTQASVRALVSALRLARSRAIAQDRAVWVVTGDRGFAVDGGAPQLLPDNEALSRSQVVFLPDGGASGPAIVLVAGQRRIALSVNWLTGRVLARDLRNQ